jgi:hypothetical protein
MTTIHQCECDICQQSEFHPEQELHRQMNLLISRLDEQQRRWYAALEAKKIGHGGATLLAKITGLSVETIRRGRYELEDRLVDRPHDRVRKPGGGRQPIEKKSLP